MESLNYNMLHCCVHTLSIIINIIIIIIIIIHDYTFVDAQCSNETESCAPVTCCAIMFIG